MPKGKRSKQFPFKKTVPAAANDEGSGNGESTVEDKLDRMEALELRCKLLNKNNHDLQKQLFEAQIKNTQLEAKVKLLEFEKGASAVVEDYQQSLRAVSEKYDLDLRVDKIDLLTGIITRAETNETEGSNQEEEN